MLACLVVGCTDPEPARQVQTIGGLQFELPVDWQQTDQSERGRQIVMWTPANNPKKQSITLIRTESLDAMAKASAELHMRHLAEAQRALRGTFAPPREFTTKRGLTGVKVDGMFTPSRARGEYSRVHAVFVDGTSLTHVIFTAAEAGDDDALQTIFDTLQRKAG